MVKQGYTIKLPNIMIGPQISRPGTTTFFPTMCMTDQEIEAMNIIEKTGVRIMMQSILSEKPVTWQEAKQKIHLQ